MATEVENGEDAPPMPVTDTVNAAFLKSLKKEIVINDDDTEEVKAVKERVRLAREEMRAQVEGGLKPREVLDMVEKMRREYAATRRQCIEEMLRIRDSGDAEGTRKYITTINLALQQMGIKEIDLPRAADDEQ